MPDVAAGLFAAAVTLLGMIAALLGLVGSKPTIVSYPSRDGMVLVDTMLKKSS